MMEGKIAGLITTYGNSVMHEAVIADVYLIPGVIIRDGVINGDRIKIGSSTLKEGDEIIIGTDIPYNAFIAKAGLGDKFFDPYKISQQIINLDFDEYSQKPYP